jgi:hypothetical protein
MRRANTNDNYSVLFREKPEKMNKINFDQNLT